MKKLSRADSFELSVAVCCGLVFVAVVIILIATASHGQEPRPNVPLLKVGEVYNVGCEPQPPMDDVVEACWVRTDVAEPVELGCTPAQGGTVARMDLSIAVEIDQVAEVRCYVVSSYGIPSDYSENAGLVDFRKPGRPFVPSGP